MPQREDLIDEMRNLICTVALGLMSTSAVLGEELRNGTFYPLEKVLADLIARAPAGTPVRFALEENGTTGYRWEVVSAPEVLLRDKQL